MSTAGRHLLRDALADPQRLPRLSLADWDLLIRQGRNARLLGRLHHQCERLGLLDRLPQPVRWHLRSAWRLYLAHRQDIEREMIEIRDALRLSGIQPVALKGAAYIACDDWPAAGRVFGDSDIFVPREQLATAEELLQWRGWETERMSPHDERYFREWMHEIPPMRHRGRGTTLDLHHNLLPLVSRFRLDAALLRRNLVETRIPGVLALGPEDRVLHSAAHLLLGGEYDNGLRDLSDIDLLLRQFGGPDPAFWERLTKRAERLGLGAILFNTLRQCRLALRTGIPEPAWRALAGHALPRRRQRLLDAMLERALRAPHPSCDDRYSGAARAGLYIAAHWLRMPVRLLVPHLLHKALITPFEQWRRERDQAEKPQP